MTLRSLDISCFCCACFLSFITILQIVPRVLIGFLFSLDHRRAASGVDMMTCLEVQNGLGFADKSNFVSLLGCLRTRRGISQWSMHKSPYRNPKVPFLKILCAGSGKTADDHIQEIKNYPTMIPHNERISEPRKTNGSARTYFQSLTIDGINEDDVNRLEAEIKEIDGILDVWVGPFMEHGIRGGSITMNLQVEADTPSLILINQIQELYQELIVLPYKLKTWKWRGHKIQYSVAGCGKPIILVHGFGGNSGHFAKLIPYLADQYRVYAVDLLGFGASDKPLDEKYGPELWADLLCDFTKEFAEEGAVLIGNSIGSLTSLTAAAKGGDTLFRGLVLLNCAGAMNRKGLMEENVLIRLLSPVFVAIEYLLERPRIASFLFDRFRRKENIRQILEEQAYRNKASVTDQLIDVLYDPSTKPGATEVFVKVFTGDPGPRPETLMEEITLPLLVLWGDSDIWTPPNGPVANFFRKLADERENVAVFSLSDVGHCPHDDRPELAASYILPFLSEAF